MRIETVIALFVCIFLSSCEFEQKELTNGEQKKFEQPYQLKQGANQEDLINSGGFTKRKLIANSVVNLATPAFKDLKNKSDRLHHSVVKYCELTQRASQWDEGVFTSLKEDLTKNWEELMKVYHLIEGFQFGPQSEGFPETEFSKGFPYGKTWDCGALTEIAKMGSDPDYYFSTTNKPYGLPNMNALTHSQSVDSFCPDKRLKDIVVQWRKKGRLERERDICKYTLLISKESNERFNRVANHWLEDQSYMAKKILDENYLGNEIETINKISDALFFIEKELKDERLAVPAGIENCLSVSCPYMTIHRTTGFSLRAVLANLKGFRMLFKGTTYEGRKDGFGFDDYLDAQKKTFIRIQMEAAINQAIESFERAQAAGESIESLSRKITDKKLCKESTTEQRNFEMCGLFQDVRRVSTLLKNEFLLALGELSAPRQVQGDMD